LDLDYLSRRRRDEIDQAAWDARGRRLEEISDELNILLINALASASEIRKRRKLLTDEQWESVEPMLPL